MRTFLLIIILSGVNSLFAQQGEALYKQYCTGCHGASLEGNSAGTLIKPKFKNTGSRATIISTIIKGVPNTDMVAWGNVLTQKEIAMLADFIVSSQNRPPAKREVIPDRIVTKDYAIKVEKLVTTDLQTPWSIEFIDNTTALISEKPGRLRWLVNNKLDSQPISGIPVPFTGSGTAGLMDIALDPQYKTNGWIYLAYSDAKGKTERNAPGMTKIIRGKIKDHEWTEQQTLFEVADPLLVVNGDRWGCRFLFDKDGYLYFTIGDMGRADDSQQLNKAPGKVYRIHPDGTIPTDNPFVNTPGALPAIYTIGNRNVQGIAQHPVTGELWTTEHGPRGGDELNILTRGANYGWPVITYGIDYSGSQVSSKTEQKGMEQPVKQWTPSIAICPAEFYTGDLFAKWKNNLLIGALAYEELNRLVLDKHSVISQEQIFKGHGRVRDIKPAPDGSIWVVLNKPDMIVRLIPE